MKHVLDLVALASGRGAPRRDHAEVLLDWLKEQGKPVSPGKILQLAPNRLRDKQRRDTAIAVLAAHNIARLERRGNNAQRLVLNPALEGNQA